MINEYYVRPIAPSDFDGLMVLAEESGMGFTSLQPDRVFLENKIKMSLKSFGPQLSDGKESNYFLVCEHLPTGRLVGSSAIKNNLGADTPSYCLKVSRLTRESKELEKRFEHRVIALSSDYHGSTELCSLFVLPSHRKEYNGQLLSRCRYLFMANFSERFNDLVIAHMRGVCTDEGVSPFWEVLGRQFFGIDYTEADFLTGIGKQQFICDLMPTSRFFISLLPPAAQAVIGQVHPETETALRLLKSESFRYRGYIDLFDAGPFVESHLQNIRTIMNQRLVTVADIKTEEITGQPMILSSTTLDFRALVTCVEHQTEERICISQHAAELLGVEKGDPLRMVAIN